MLRIAFSSRRTGEVVFALGTWVEPDVADPALEGPGVVIDSRNIFNRSIPDYQQVTVEWRDGGRMVAGAHHFHAVAPPPLECQDPVSPDGACSCYMVQA